MKHSVMLTIASLLLVLLLTFHLADDIRRGFEPGGLSNLVGGVLITVVWLYGILVLAERRSGYIIMFLLSLFSLVVPYVHMKGRGVGVTSRIANSSGHFFFVWTLLAIGVLGLFSAILAARGLWSLRRGPAPVVQQPSPGTSAAAAQDSAKGENFRQAKETNHAK
jgi:hypothetical protein